MAIELKSISFDMSGATKPYHTNKLRANMLAKSDEWKSLTDTNGAKVSLSPQYAGELYTPMLSKKLQQRMVDLFNDIENELNRL